MNIDFSQIYRGIDLGVSLTGGLVKILVGLLLFAIVFYAFMFILKLRVLQDTIDISASKVAKIIVSINLLVSLVGSIISVILILL